MNPVEVVVSRYKGSMFCSSSTVGINVVIGRPLWFDWGWGARYIIWGADPGRGGGASVRQLAK